MPQSNLLTTVSIAAAMICICALAQPAAADEVYWTNWTSATTGTTNGTASGTITTNGGPVGVTYSGEITGDTHVSGTCTGCSTSGYPSWTPTTTWADGTNIADAPNFEEIIGQHGGDGTGVNSITFSVAVTDPIMAIWSLGSGGDDANYTFNSNETYQILAGGPSAEYGGQGLVPNGGDFSVTGSEGNGTLQFLGTFTQITFTNTNFEDWYGFTLGAFGIAPAQQNNDVPEPFTLSLFGAGLAGAAALRRRKKKVLTA